MRNGKPLVDFCIFSQFVRPRSLAVARRYNALHGQRLFHARLHRKRVIITANKLGFVLARDSASLLAGYQRLLVAQQANSQTII